MRPPSHIFRAYDIRGKYPREMNEAAAEKVGYLLAKYFKPGPVLVGRDVRLSSPSLYRAVLKGLARAGRRGRVIAAGPMTSPMFSFLSMHLKAAGGLMVTASHNPKEYNGIKAVREEGVYMSGKEIYGLFKNV